MNKGKTCASYTNKFKSQVKSCNFEMFGIVDPKAQNGTIVTIPKNTVLYHATISFPKKGETHWFSKNCPNNEVNWFTPSLDHIDYHNYTHVLAYFTAEPIRVIFYQNIPERGNVFFPTLTQSKEFQDKEIDGYIGCNECEIALMREAVNAKFKRMTASLKSEEGLASARLKPRRSEVVQRLECENNLIRDKSKYID